MIQRAAQDAGLPFLNIVQACTWTPSMRVPTTNELRYLIQHQRRLWGSGNQLLRLLPSRAHRPASRCRTAPDGRMFHELKRRQPRVRSRSPRSFSRSGCSGPITRPWREPGCVPLRRTRASE